jgi:hypothetical protein
MNDASPEDTNGPRRPTAYWAVIGLGLFVTYLSQPGQIGELPLNFLLKDELALTAFQNSLFWLVVTFPWNLKVLPGLLSDSLPFLGTRRRHYLLLSSGAAAGLWLVLGITPQSFLSLLGTALVMNSMIVVASSVTGALVVEEGQKHGATGRLAAVRFALISVAGVIAGPAGGFLASYPFYLTGIVGACLLVTFCIGSFSFVREEQYLAPNPHVWTTTWLELKQLCRSGPLWSAAVMTFLVFIEPGFRTPLFYYQTDNLKFSPEFIGMLAALNGGFNVLGALLYVWCCKRFQLRHLLPLGILVRAAGTLSYLSYRSHETAVLIESSVGLTNAFAEVALFDLAARATPKGCEALGYALLMRISNIADGLSDVSGSWLFDKYPKDQYQVAFVQLVLLNAGTTALALLAVPLLPRRLVSWREGETGKGGSIGDGARPDRVE